MTGGLTQNNTYSLHHRKSRGQASFAEASLNDCFHTWAAKRIVKWTEPDSGLWTVCLTREVDVRSPVWMRAYPHLTDFLHDGPATPKRNIFSKNVSVNTVPFQVLWTPADNPLPAAHFLKEDNYTVNYNPGFVNPRKENFQLKNNSEVYQKIPKFKPIPWNRIGLLKDKYRAIPSTVNERKKYSSDF